MTRTDRDSTAKLAALFVSTVVFVAAMSGGVSNGVLSDRESVNAVLSGDAGNAATADAAPPDGTATATPGSEGGPGAGNAPADSGAGNAPADSDAGNAPADSDAGNAPADSDAENAPADPGAGNVPADREGGTVPIAPSGDPPKSGEANVAVGTAKRRGHPATGRRRPGPTPSPGADRSAPDGDDHSGIHGSEPE